MKALILFVILLYSTLYYRTRQLTHSPHCLAGAPDWLLFWTARLSISITIILPTLFSFSCIPSFIIFIFIPISSSTITSTSPSTTTTITTTTLRPPQHPPRCWFWPNRPPRQPLPPLPLHSSSVSSPVSVVDLLFFFFLSIILFFLKLSLFSPLSFAHNNS